MRQHPGRVYFGMLLMLLAVYEIAKWFQDAIH